MGGLVGRTCNYCHPKEFTGTMEHAGNTIATLAAVVIILVIVGVLALAMYFAR